LLGIALGFAFWQVFPNTIWLWAPFVAGLVASIPLAVVSADARLGRLLAASGLCRIPEEARLPEHPENTLLFRPLPLYQIDP
jgi:membrane glycosyltransferase